MGRPVREFTSETLTLGREAYRRHDWSSAHSQFLDADRVNPLVPADLEQLAMAAHLVGLDTDSTAYWSRAHRDYLENDDSRGAARCAFWLSSLALMIEGDPASSAGWQARGLRLLDDGGPDCVERGYLLMVNAIQCLFMGDHEAAQMGFDYVAAFGERFKDPNLTAICRLGKGQVLVRMGHVTEGMALFDDVMVSITAGDMQPMFAGIAYCAVIEDCELNFETRRAQVWTESLDRWSSAQPGLVPYRRQCLAHRAAILRFHGAWLEAIAEATQACDMTSQVPDRLSTAEAWYQRAEVHRLRGEHAMAEEAYRQASRLGRTTNPGLALLRLDQGSIDAARTSIRRELGETEDPRARAALLSAGVEVLLEAGDLDAASSAAEELSAVADALRTPPFLQAMALQAVGAVALARGDARSALLSLRPAWKAWFDLEAPYEAGRVRVLIGRCCRDLGDLENAELEFEAAEQIFLQLGAIPALSRLHATTAGATDSKHVGGLTDRELAVLRLVVAGKTNHAIASELVISDHTARRHIQNIFAKLGVSSRAAATAFALQNDLI